MHFQRLLLLDGAGDHDVLDAMAVQTGEQIGNCDMTDRDDVGRIAFPHYNNSIGITLVEIDYYCKKPLMKLKEYKGEDLEVIHEAAAFVSESAYMVL
ncbi:hypothetical protein U1Q18_007995 [Sarracenia purpurea var. burkii]